MKQSISFLISFFCSIYCFAGMVKLISPEDLHALKAPYAVVDVRSDYFFEGHLPNSQRLVWKEWTQERPSIWNLFFGNSSSWGQVRTDPDVQKELRRLGLSNDGLIVVVGEPHGWGDEGRVAWSLLYWGASQVAILDGGFPAWQSKKYPIERGPSKPRTPGHFNLNLQPHRRANLETLSKNLSSDEHTVFDVRTLEEFQGKKLPGQTRGGHLPKARLVPQTLLYKKDGRYITPQELKSLIGLEYAKNPITYCTGGVRSALLAVLLEAYFDIIVANYDGSLWEWSSRSDLPLE